MSRRNVVILGLAIVVLVALGVIVAGWGGDDAGSPDDGSSTAALVAVFVAVFAAIYAGKSKNGAND